MSKETTRVDIGRSRWLRELAPIVALAKKNPGFAARLTRELNKVSQGRQWKRQQVWSMLNPDEDKRRQPLLGLGLVLIDAARRVEKALKAEGEKVPREAYFEKFPPAR